MPTPRLRILAPPLATVALLVTVATLHAGAQPCAAHQSSAVDPRYRAGLGLLERGEHTMALAELEAYLATSPAEPERSKAEYARGICLHTLGRSTDAASAFDRVLGAKDFEFRADALLLRARIAFDAKGYDDAARFAGTLAREFPAFPHLATARQIEGESLVRAGKPAEGRTALDALLAAPSAMPAPPELRRRAALMAAHASVLLKDDRGAIDRLDAVGFTNAPAAERASAELLAAQSFHRLNDLAAAFDRYQSAARIAPSDEALLGVGQTGRAIGQRGAAASALDTLLAPGRTVSSATRVAATIERARIALEQKDAVLARGLLESVDPPADQVDRVLSWRANAQAAAGDRPTAIATLTEALRRAPTSPLASAMRFDLAGMLLAEERWSDAAEAYARFLTASPESPLAPQARVRAALCAARLGERDAAREAFAVALSSLPPDATAERELCLAESLELATRAASWSEVERFARDLLSLSKEPARRAEAMLRLGIAAARTDRADEAVSTFDQLLREYPQSSVTPHATLERAEARWALGASQEAIADFRAVAALTDPAHAAIRSAAQARLANVLLRSGDPSAAASLLAGAEGDSLIDLALAQSMEGRHREATETLSRYLAANESSPRSAEARARRGIAYARLGDAAKAEADLQAAARGPLAPELAAAATFERGVVLLELRRTAEAEATLTSLLAQPSAYRPFAAIELTRLAVDAGANERASTLLTASVDALPDARASDRAGLEERQRYFEGILAARAGRHTDAIAALSDLVTRFPTSALAKGAQLVLGESLLADGQAARAAEAFRAALSGTLEPAVQDATLLRLGESLAAAQRWKESEAAFREHLERHPTSSRAYQARFGEGWALEQQGHHEAAIERYRQVVAQHDGATAARAQFQIGECLFALKRLDDAVREFLKVDVLYAHPEWSAAALYEAGRCLASLGRVEDAKRQFAAVRDRFASTRWAELARRDEALLAPDSLPHDRPGRGDRPTGS